MATTPRRATIERRTHETEIHLECDLDGTGQHDIDTGVGFLDHMLAQIARHGRIDLKIRTKGDTHIDFTTPPRTRDRAGRSDPAGVGE